MLDVFVPGLFVGDGMRWAWLRKEVGDETNWTVVGPSVSGP